jgi:hypothetical protein
MSKRGPFVKRQAARARVGATAFVLRAEGCAGPFVVDNLSAGGALLLGGSGWRPGETFEIQLRLHSGAELRTSAAVLRCERRREEMSVAVQFQNMPADVEDALQDAVAAALEHHRAQAAAAIVVVTPWPHDADVVSGAISRSGATPLIVTTFLDALRWLQDPRMLVKALIVDADAESGSGMEALEWCAAEFPAVRRVLLVPEAGGAEQRNTQRACATLARPITARRLARALGRVSARRRSRARSAASSPA